MDLALLISALTLLLTVVSEIRSSKKDQSTIKLREIGLSLYQMVAVLDKIIETGEEILEHLASYDPVSQDNKQNELLRSLLHEQESNLKALSRLYEIPIKYIDSDVRVSLGTAIELVTPAKLSGPVKRKWRTIRKVLSWKRLAKVSPSRLSFTANQIVTVLTTTSVKLNPTSKGLILQFPKKLQVQLKRHHRAVGIEYKEYSLNEADQLHHLIVEGHQQIQSLRVMRSQLSEFTRNSFPLDKLVLS